MKHNCKRCDMWFEINVFSHVGVSETPYCPKCGNKFDSDCGSPQLCDVADVKYYVNLIREYISFLNEELTELASIASVHGWKSSRYKIGVKKRKELSKFTEKFGNVV